MKKKIIFTLLAASFAMLSCEKILNTTPQIFISPINYYKTEKDLQSALAGVYDRLGDLRLYAQGMSCYLVFSDEFYMNGRTSGIDANIIDASTLEINRHWEAIYTGIERANMLLDNMVPDNISKEKYDEIRGQALFLRAYYYFLLVDHFGSVPLKLKSTKSPAEEPLPGSSIKDIYEQILKDMKEAENFVRPISDYGYNTRVSKTAVQGIIARVCLTMAGYPLNDKSKYREARDYAKLVMESGKHNLTADFSQIFIKQVKGEFDMQESIWEVEFRGKNQGEIMEGGYIGSYNGIQCPNNDVGFGTGYVRTTAKLYNAYGTDDDLRRGWTVAPFYYVASGSTAIKQNWSTTQIYERSNGKWRREYETDLPRVQYYTGTNWPLLRYADVLLMFAEAENELNGPTDAYNAVNMVRRRGYGKDLNTINNAVDAPQGMDKQQFLAYIQDERLRELAFEGLRKHDLIRWGIYVSTMQYQVGVYRTGMPSSISGPAIAQAERVTNRALLFPIPGSEMSVNYKMKQNPGW